jgi:hypothetical protein
MTADGRYAELLERREEILLSLSVPILVCQANHDTPSPMFHGCFDWHSCVHAVYALYTIHQRTDEPLFLEAARQQARPELCEAELAYVAENVAANETPYGFAWILALVAKQEQVTGERGLRPLADDAARRVAAFVEGLDAESARAYALVDRHQNLSWALIHLALWGAHAGDAASASLARSATERFLADPALDDAFPLAGDAAPALEFMPTSMLRLAAVAQVLGHDAGAFVRERVPRGFSVPPITEPVGVHAGGAGLFRAYALWDLYEATGDEAIRESFAALILYQMTRPDLWRQGPIDGYRHWAAQIAVRAIDRTYGAV